MVRLRSLDREDQHAYQQQIEHNADIAAHQEPHNHFSQNPSDPPDRPTRLVKNLVTVL